MKMEPAYVSYLLDFSLKLVCINEDRTCRNGYQQVNRSKVSISNLTICSLLAGDVMKLSRYKCIFVRSTKYVISKIQMNES